MFNPAAVLRRLEKAGAKAAELCCDSRRIKKGDIFVAAPGEQADGRDYIAAAVAAGAGGVLWESHEFTWPKTIRAANVPVENLAARAGLIADSLYKKPSKELSVAAVTATNGKTTIAHFAAQLLSQAGITAGVVGTLGAGVFGKKYSPLENTTPGAVCLHRLLRDFVGGGCKAAAIEASSHGIAQGRLNGIRLSAAALANIGRDHLDYHGDHAAYRRAKGMLLQTEELQTAIVNADDSHCMRAAKNHRAARLQTFGKKGNALRLLSAAEDKEGCRLTLDGDDGRREILLRTPGAHNMQNFMAAALIARNAGAEWDSFCPEELSLPAGRLQRVNPGQGPAVYVDYAHTPDALSAAIAALQNRRGRLWLVFGCGGMRDPGKRRQMGKVATRADEAIVTDDNPRGEKSENIRADILAGGLHLREVPGRGEAIAAAIEKSAAADTVLIAGKGHETYQEAEGKRQKFSDVEVARALLAARGRIREGRC